jgi:hypothetical protein
MSDPRILPAPAKEAPRAPASAPAWRFPLLASILLTAFVYSCAIYANLSFAVKNQVNYKYFPPFKPFVNMNQNRHLGAEYYNIAQSLVKNQGFANPFGERTGPTAWMPPLFPTLLAGLIWICDNDKDAVMAVVIFFQVFVLVGTGLMVLVLVQQTGRWVGAWVASAFFVLGLICNFRLAFQFTHDCWLVLLALDLVIAGFCWLRPLDSWTRSAIWGLIGGFCALINPVTAFAWGVFTCLLGLKQGAWSRLGIALLAAGIVLTPWTVRNFLVFGRLVPVKSNVAYELYQSQCLQRDGLIQAGTFGSHPYASAGRERQEYKQVGEMQFLDNKKAAFWKAVWEDPEDFLDRVAMRFLGTTLWYQPYDRNEEMKQPWVLWLCRLTYPLPFLGLLLLVFTSIWDRLHWAQWTVIGVYTIYLLPYIGVSFYERYSFPLLGAKVLLMVWGVDRLLDFLPRRRRKTGQQTVSRPAAVAPKKSKAASASEVLKTSEVRRQKERCMSLSGCLITLAGLLAGQPPTELYQDFRGGKMPQAPLKLVGPTDLNERVRPEEKGLRITLPKDRPKRQAVGIAPDFPLVGDFEITASYEILDADQPTSGFGVGVNLLVATTHNQSDKVAFVARFWLNDGRSGYLSRITFKNPPQINKFPFDPTDVKIGRLRLKREGEMLHYLVSDDLEQDFKEIFQHEFGREDIASVRFVANTGEAPWNVNVRLIDFKVRSEGVPASDPAPISSPTRRSLLPLLMGMSALLLLLAAVFFWLWSKTRLAKPADAATPAGEASS